MKATASIWFMDYFQGNFIVELLLLQMQMHIMEISTRALTRGMAIARTIPVTFFFFPAWIKEQFNIYCTIYDVEHEAISWVTLGQGVYIESNGSLCHNMKTERGGITYQNLEKRDNFCQFHSKPHLCYWSWEGIKVFWADEWGLRQRLSYKKNLIAIFLCCDTCCHKMIYGSFLTWSNYDCWWELWTIFDLINWWKFPSERDCRKFSK